MFADDAGLPVTFDWATRTDGHLSTAQRDRIRAAIRRGYGDIVRGVAGWPFRRSRASSETFSTCARVNGMSGRRMTKYEC